MTAFCRSRVPQDLRDKIDQAGVSARTRSSGERETERDRERERQRQREMVLCTHVL